LVFAACALINGKGGIALSVALLTLLAFLAACLGVAAVYSILSDLFLRDRSRVSKRVDEEFRKRQRDRAMKSTLFKNLGQAAADVAEEEAHRTWRQRFEALVEQSGLELSPRRLLFLMVGIGCGLGLAAGMIRQSLLIAAMAAPVGALLPFLYVAVKRKARMEKMMSQLPDAFDLMARVIRAGQTMSQAMQAVADEFDKPLAAEFTYCYEQQNLGLPPEVALRDLARRTGLLEVKIFVLALVVQQQTGGPLAELLDNLATVIRERFRIRGKIRALTAEGRMQALVLLSLPPLLLFIIMLINRNYGQVLLNYPGLLVGTFVCEALGALWIRKIVNFDF
jgi:tight adherence protein B